MSVVFASIVPHNPILLPAIGRDNTSLLKASLDAIEKVKELIVKQDIDTLIIFSSHAPRLEKAFGINQCNKYIGTFEQFGDLVTTVASRGDIELSQQIKEYLEPKTSIQTYCQPEVDYGISVPLELLQTDTKSFKIIPISIANMDTETHFSIGKELLEKADISPKKIGIIASLHLSHNKGKELPSINQKCDNSILQAIKDGNIETLKDLSQDELKQAGIYGIEGLFFLLGMIDEKKYTSEILAFQNVLGISHLTAQFTW